jgi:hypothetical protein
VAVVPPVPGADRPVPVPVLPPEPVPFPVLPELQPHAKNALAKMTLPNLVLPTATSSRCLV